MVETPELVCTARSITNTSTSVKPIACCWMPWAHWEGAQPGVTPIPESPLPPDAIPMFPHAVIHTAHPPPPASHPGTPNLTQTPHLLGHPGRQLT